MLYTSLVTSHSLDLVSLGRESCHSNYYPSPVSVISTFQCYIQLPWHPWLHVTVELTRSHGEIVLITKQKNLCERTRLQE